ncbi:gamma carbonic anhydrase family protein [Bacillus aquiflavi]|uniref:Gamma carbonic anhydrase family protein n=1 Tax=Bacillus aquiflavi TaxID=2672567 RepID=A0A6B3W1I6_9BACI|nr:gamma carbonic anhydrase family protein [Bacillus aquiflavi]MBA4537510.1 gamma carbonic anhydrase family protein [Bacillus aquiflavi]NEY81766.1 gamma carbonic anhydrase family protein [Bacillus aquiflavi]UAC47472.1 gamma carbonic anhydrase family protein [Bacillus aquiflavi]
MIFPYKNKLPQIDETVFIAPGAKIIGDVKVGKHSSIWFNAVLRGDEAPIIIGERCSIQDNTTCHLYEEHPLIIENDVTVGHHVILHGCKIRKAALIGMGSTILDDAEIGEYTIIGANTLIPPGKKIPARSLVVGSPGKVIRELTEKDFELIQLSITTYVQKGIEYKEQFSKF